MHRQDGTALEIMKRKQIGSLLKFKRMKRIFTFFTFFILGLTVFAAGYPSGGIIVSSNSRGDVKVILDGRRYESGDNEIRIRDVRAGMHDIKIYRQKNFGLFSSFVKNYELLYDGRLILKEGRQIIIRVDRFGKTDIGEQKIRRDKGRDYNRDYGYDRNDRDADWNDRSGGYDHNGYNNYSRAINDRDFDLVIRSMSKEWYENNKMESARHIIATNYFTSEQVGQMIRLFNFENNKLELAKLAYNKTIDPRNYQQVFGELNFSSSKAELSRYIQDQR